MEGSQLQKEIEKTKSMIDLICSTHSGKEISVCEEIVSRLDSHYEKSGRDEKILVEIACKAYAKCKILYDRLVSLYPILEEIDPLKHFVMS